jgi:hypothetical protein
MGIILPGSFGGEKAEAPKDPHSLAGSRGIENIFGASLPTPEAMGFSKPPTNPADYNMYAAMCAQEMAETVNMAGAVNLDVNCEERDKRGNMIPLRKKKPSHLGGGLTYACRHVLANDPINPWGVIFFPFERNGTCGYYLCETCYGIMCKKNFDMNNVHGYCRLCILEAVNEVFKKDPSRVRDARTWS